MKCPFCDYEAETARRETEHMMDAHAEIVEARMIEAGYRRGADGEWIDTRGVDDDDGR